MDSQMNNLQYGLKVIFKLNFVTGQGIYTSVRRVWKEGSQKHNEADEENIIYLICLL